MVIAISCVPAGAGLQLNAGATLSPLHVYRGSIAAPSRQGAVTASTAAAVAVVAPTLVVDTSIGPPGAPAAPASVSKKLSSVSGTVAAAVVLTLPFWLGRAGRNVRPSWRQPEASNESAASEIGMATSRRTTMQPTSRLP